MSKLLKDSKAVNPLVATLMFIIIAIAGSMTTYSWITAMIESQSQQVFFSPKPEIEIADSLVSQSRCDVGSTQTVYFHAVWYPTGKAVEEGLIYVNGTAYTLNVTGWISFTHSSSTVSKKTWVVTDVKCNGVTEFFVTASNPNIIWDRVQVTLDVSDNRINAGNCAPITWTGVYEYDGSQFTGTVSLNDTLIQNLVGKYWYTATSISDPTYGITVFEANTVYCIFDKVTIELSVGNDRIDVGSRANITLDAVYQYDNTEYDGSIVLNDTITKSATGKYGYSVLSIGGDKHGITVFESNTVFTLHYSTRPPVTPHESPFLLWIAGIVVNMSSIVIGVMVVTLMVYVKVIKPA